MRKPFLPIPTPMDAQELEGTDRSSGSSGQSRVGSLGEGPTAGSALPSGRRGRLDTLSRSSPPAWTGWADARLEVEAAAAERAAGGVPASLSALSEIGARRVREGERPHIARRSSVTGLETREQLLELHAKARRK